MLTLNLQQFILSIDKILIYFPIYGFLGWIGEVIYRSATRKQLINPGLLNGPFLPLYGSAAVLIIFLTYIIPINNPLFYFIFFSVFASAIEYGAAALAENYFKVRLWEYDDYRFNLKGRICLRFSIYWGIYVLIFLYLIHPFIYSSISNIKDNISIFSNDRIYFLLLFTINTSIFIDFLISVKAMKRFVSTLNLFIEEYLSLENQQVQNYLYKMRKPMKKFRALRKHADNEIKTLLENNLSGQMKNIKNQFNEKLFSHKPDEKEFHEIIAEIIKNEKFLELDNYLHHDASILNHSRKVAFAAYKMAKYLGLDYKSTARGALLHDFFLYDWRKNEGRPYKGGLHGFRHPRVALNNAEKYFSLNKIERDIIIRHMWPLTIIPPRYKESILVMFIDKYISSIESIIAVKNKKAGKKENNITHNQN